MVERDGLRKIIGCLFEVPENLGLPQLRVKTGLSKPTILHHLNYLVKDGIVKKDNQNKYSVFI